VKVLLITSFWHQRGGDSTVWRAEYAGLRARGHEVVPFAMRHPDNDPSPWEVRFPPWLDVSEGGAGRVVRVARALWNPAAARALEELLTHWRPDVAHAHHIHRHLTPSVLPVLHGHRIPVAWTAHDYELICATGLAWRDDEPCFRCAGGRWDEAVRGRCRQGDLAQSVFVAAEKRLHQARGVWGLVDRFIAPSRFMAEALIRAGLPQARVVHLPNGVAEQPAADGPGRGWIYAGRLAEEKGVRDLVEVALALPEHGLTVVGDGPLARTLPRLPNVRWLGHRDPTEVARRLRQAAVAVVPSRWPENQPFAVLEAQMAARPVVAASVGGVPELVTDGEDGVLVPPGRPDALAAAVRALLDAPERAARIGAAGRARVLREHDMDRWLSRLERVLGEL
jgi:glycosyltransferase involved in cell wall biosynthesis